MTPLGKFLITGMATGYLRPAPGTWGSVAVVGIYIGLFHLFSMLGCPHITVSLSIAMGVVVLLSSVTCVTLGHAAIEHFGRKDPSQVVIDEWAGQALTLIMLPVVANSQKSMLITAGVAFVLFRLFDITKPPPVRQAERLPEGWGILADDLVAGVLANIVAQIILRSGVIPCV